MTIHIEELKFQSIIGILDFERVTPQDIIINMSIKYRYEDGFINYADIVQMLKETMIKSEFLLIEEALDAINVIATKKYPSIQNIKIKITKPSILKDCSVSVSNYYKSKS